MQRWDSRVALIEGYLDRNFGSAFIHSNPQRSEERPDAHTFRIEQNRHTYTLSICRDFIDNFNGDTSDWDRAVGMNTPGQSGDTRSPFYDNLFEFWANDQFHPVFYSRNRIEEVTARRIELRPGG